MLLVIDIGNTNIKMALFEDDAIVGSWRFENNTKSTADEYGLKILGIMREQNLDPKSVTGIIFSSVVPRLNYTIEHMCTHYFNIKPKIVGSGIKTGINIKCDSPKEVGADRITDCYAALKLYGAPAIVIDFGTATTVNAINDRGEFLGGAICPGIKTSQDALTSAAAKLPPVELLIPKSVIGRDTDTNIQSGFSFGFIGMVEYLVKKIRQESGMQGAKCIATGGLAEIITNGSDIIDVYDRALTLKGLNLIYKLNLSK